MTKPKPIHITMWNAPYMISDGSCWTKIVIALAFWNPSLLGDWKKASKNHSINSKAHENNRRKTKETAKHFIRQWKKITHYTLTFQQFKVILCLKWYYDLKFLIASNERKKNKKCQESWVSVFWCSTRVGSLCNGCCLFSEHA